LRMQCSHSPPASLSSLPLETKRALRQIMEALEAPSALKLAGLSPCQAGAQLRGEWVRRLVALADDVNVFVLTESPDKVTLLVHDLRLRVLRLRRPKHAPVTLERSRTNPGKRGLASMQTNLFQVTSPGPELDMVLGVWDADGSVVIGTPDLITRSGRAVGFRVAAAVRDLVRDIPLETSTLKPTGSDIWVKPYVPVYGEDLEALEVDSDE